MRKNLAMSISAIRMPALALAMALAVSGCVSLGKEPPPSLFTLTPANPAPAGHSTSFRADQALVVIDPNAPQKLDVTRVPVQVNEATVAYLKDAMWVEKPARLFGRLLAETVRSGQKRMVVEGTDVRFAAATKLSGQLLDMGYDAPSQSVIVRFDAVVVQADGTILTRRFESTVPGVSPDALSVAPALNQAANAVAAQVADWVG